MERIYTHDDGFTVARLITNGLKGTQWEQCPVNLIGSLNTKYLSTHDIDILIDCNITDRDKELILIKLKDILHTDNKVIYTDWGGLYFTDTPLGDIDVFFEFPNS